MKKIIILLSLLFCGVVHADTETLNWYIDGQTYATTTCQTGGDIILPTAPTPPYGYTFAGWQSYTPIEYIESTGTQWIDTGISGLDIGDWQLYLKWMPLNMENPGYNLVFGAYTNEESNTYRIIYNHSQTNFYLYGNTRAGGGAASVLDVAINEIHEVSLNNGYVIFDGRQQDISLKGKTISNTAKISLCGRGYRIKGRFYASWATQDGVYKYDFIPVLDPNGTPCMYDKVSHKFFYNSGTGDFIAGPIIAE